jgi:hypothetical protein
MPLFCMSVSQIKNFGFHWLLWLFFNWFWFYSLRSTRGLVHVVMVGYIVDHFCFTFLIFRSNEMPYFSFLNIYIYTKINFLQSISAKFYGGSPLIYD